MAKYVNPNHPVAKHVGIAGGELYEQSSGFFQGRMRPDLKSATESTTLMDSTVVLAPGPQEAHRPNG